MKLRNNTLNSCDIEGRDQASIECDGFDAKRNVYKLMFIIPDLVKLKSFVRKAIDENDADRFKIYCYKHQVPMLNQLVRGKAKVLSIDINKVLSYF
jgi:hypothetical protein